VTSTYQVDIVSIRKPCHQIPEALCIALTMFSMDWIEPGRRKLFDDAEQVLLRGVPGGMDVH